MFAVMFIIGAVFGSFYNVVGYRVPNRESILYPASHCTKCNHKLKFYELFPIISYVFLRGKCSKCGDKISLFYPFFEFLTGLLFGLCYVSFGFSYELIIDLTFISMLIIITVSDVIYMIIPDEILIFFGCILGLEKLLIYGLGNLFISAIHGAIAFVVMFLIKKMGDFIFKRESMGGGDIKLLFVFGFVLDAPSAILSIFVGSFIGLPVSLLFLKMTKKHIIPFGPLLAIGAVVILLMHIDMNTIVNFLSY